MQTDDAHSCEKPNHIQMTTLKVDTLIVGAGLTGATFAERLSTKHGETVLIIDKRPHIAGNAYDEYNDAGILEHRYGPHIFHTNSANIWNYLSQFTSWRKYHHKVVASIEGQLVPVPVNLNTINALFGGRFAQEVERKLITAYGYGSRIPILKLLEARDQELRFLSEFIYQNVFLGYTKKQWGMLPEDLSPSVTARVPIVISRDDRYFQDRYQAMPARGYTHMVQQMLASNKIKILLNTDWREVKSQVSYRRLVFTGPIDEYFEYKYGALPYRSLSFEMQTYASEDAQGSAVINYPNEYDYTRVTELKKITGQYHRQTTTITEYPTTYEIGRNVPYYPIPTDENRKLFTTYEQEADAIAGRVIFAGRLADYQYYNMDQAVARALSITERL